MHRATGFGTPSVPPPTRAPAGALRSRALTRDVAPAGCSCSRPAPTGAVRPTRRRDPARHHRGCRRGGSGGRCQAGSSWPPEAGTPYMAVSLAITVVVACHAADMIRKIIGRLRARLHPPHVDHLATGLLQQG